MDRIIDKYPSVPFGELQLCTNVGIAYQRDMTNSVPYDEAYFDKYVSYEDTEISKKINAGRIALSHRYCSNLLDIGVGSGEFIKKSTARMYGYDINPKGISWLKSTDRWVDPYDHVPESIEGVTFWDTLEHIKEPTKLLDRFWRGMHVFVAIPIFDDLTKVRFSKHYRPNEHYYYFTSDGLCRYMNDAGFTLIELCDRESLAGRENILSFAFRKN